MKLIQRRVDTSFASFWINPLSIAWPRQHEWRLVILDEAQAIRNSGTRQSRAAKELIARGRIALTGTPVENRLSDLWSIFDFLNPCLLGGAQAFGRMDPIAAYTWIVILAHTADLAQSAAVRELLRWILMSGQKECSALGYVPLPRGIADSQVRTLDGVRK